LWQIPTKTLAIVLHTTNEPVAARANPLMDNIYPNSGRMVLRQVNPDAVTVCASAEAGNSPTLKRWRPTRPGPPLPGGRGTDLLA